MAVNLQGNVKIPGVGEVPKPVAYGTVGLVGAYLAWRWWQASAATAPAEDPDAEVTDEYAEGDYAVGTYQPPTITDSSGSYDLTGGAEVIDTDAEWTQAVVELLAGYGVDPVTASLAIGKYLRHQQLTAAQADIVTQALALQGYPPQAGHIAVITAPTGTPSTPSTPSTPAKKAAAKKKAAAAPASRRYVTVASGDTLSEIAARNKTTVSRLKKFTENRYLFTNKTTGRKRSTSGRWIYPGDRVRVR